MVAMASASPIAKAKVVLVVGAKLWGQASLATELSIQTSAFLTSCLNFMLESANHILSSLLCNIEYVENIQNSQSVQDDEGDEPSLVPRACCRPEGVAFPRQNPNHSYYKNPKTTSV